MSYYQNLGQAPYESYEPYRYSTANPTPPAASANPSAPNLSDPNQRHPVSATSFYGHTTGNPYDPPPIPLHGRESLVSLDSHAGMSSPIENPPAGNAHNRDVYSPDTAWSGTFGYSSNTGGTYTPVHGARGSTLSRLSKSFRKAGFPSTRKQPVHESIDEEEYDLSLLSTSAPMGMVPQHEPVAEEHDFVPGFDVTAALGPMTSQDADFIKNLQEQEARGNLTGGLGAGFQPDTRVRDAELLSGSRTGVQRGLSRSFTSRHISKRLGRAETIRFRGQDEANRRGEVIEVILESTGTDLSNMEGPHTVADDERRRSTFSVKQQPRSEIFYPQPNWKPVSMRWPYLTWLVTLSVVLAVTQEYLFQKFNGHPVLKFKSPDDVSGGLYFIVKFCPTMAAVAYGVFWQFTDIEVRRLEAYYQLSRPSGALASKSINADYVTSFSFLRPLHALRLGHYAVALSSIASTLAVSLVPTFAAASVVLTPDRQERLAHPEATKQIIFASAWSRLLTSTLIIIAALGGGLFYVLQTRRSGLLADVRGIAGLASMAVVSHILMDFKDMDTAKHKDIHDKLKRRRYMLRNSSLAPYDGSTASVQGQDQERDDGNHLSENPHPLMLRPAGMIPYIVGLVAFIIFIPAVLFTEASIITDKAGWAVTALAIILKLCWGGMETSVRVMEPYYLLSQRHAPAKALSLDYTALPFGYMPIRALLDGHILVFLVGFGSVMAEFLTIMVTSLATAQGESFMKQLLHDEDREDEDRIDSGIETSRSFYISLAITLFVLVYMTVVATIVFIRRRHPFLPRQPNTISSILAYIHQSKMLYTFVGTSKLTAAEMGKQLDETSTTYGLGWFSGRDGKTHCGIDQEELERGYKHGLIVPHINKPWEQQWDVL